MSQSLEHEALTTQEATRSRGVLRDLLRRRSARVGLLMVALLGASAVLGPLASPYAATERVGQGYTPPDSHHWLGLDDGGVDMLSLIFSGLRVSLLVGFVAALVAVVIGGAVGLVAGYFGRWIDQVLMRVTDYFIVIPDVPLMIVAAAVFGRSLTNIIVIIGLIYWVSTARLVRAQVKSVCERVYVHRARSLGAGHWRLIRHHILPQVMPLLVANGVLMIAIAVFAETYVSFLGLGDPAAISLGRLIQNSLDGGAIFGGAWWAIIPPGLCVTLLILACTMIGQSMEESLNPRLATGHLSVRRFRVLPSRAKEDLR